MALVLEAAVEVEAIAVVPLVLEAVVEVEVIVVEPMERRSCCRDCMLDFRCKVGGCEGTHVHWKMQKRLRMGLKEFEAVRRGLLPKSYSEDRSCLALLSS